MIKMKRLYDLINNFNLLGEHKYAQEIFKISSKITHQNIPDFGNPNKTEDQKKIDTMMAWVGMTDVKDLEPEDQQNFLNAIKGKST